MKYSNQVAVVKLVKPAGAYRWHHFYECLASFRINRNRDIDNILKIADLIRTFGREYRGIRQGSTAQQVIDSLGEPTERHTTQAMGFYYWHYLPEKLTIFFQNERVKEIRDDPSGRTDEN